VLATLGLVIGATVGSAARWNAAVPAFAVLALCIAPLVVIDVEHHRLPDRLVVTAGLGGVLLLTAPGQWGRWLGALEAAIVVSAVLAGIAFVGQLGLGDVKLGAVLGLYTGWFGWGCALNGVLLGFVLGGVAAAALLIVRRAGRKSLVAFGPWLILGALSAVLLA
jgi:leader peptidase (prepilin peptidase)/N-methyltransferase